MAKENKMYSIEIVDKATSAVAMGFISNNNNCFKESIKELPDEIQLLVVALVLTGRNIIRAQIGLVLSKASEIEKKLKEIENPTKEDVDRLFKEVFEKKDKEK